MSATTSHPLFFKPFTPSAGHRELGIAVVMSLALHALMLALFPDIDVRAPVPSAVPVLTATIAPRIVEPETDSPSAARAARPRDPAPPKPALKPPADPAPAVRTAPETAVPFVQEAPPPAGVDAAPEAAPAQTERAAPSAPVALEPRTPDPPAAGEPTVRLPSRARLVGESDAGSLDQYRLALIVQAKRYKRYPAQAVERGWAGTVEVRLVIAPDGVMRDALIKSSSGYRVLDDQALDMVKKAKPLTMIPPALRGREFSVDIPVIFDLQTG